MVWRRAPHVRRRAWLLHLSRLRVWNECGRNDHTLTCSFLLCQCSLPQESAQIFIGARSMLSMLSRPATTTTPKLTQKCRTVHCRVEPTPTLHLVNTETSAVSVRISLHCGSNACRFVIGISVPEMPNPWKCQMPNAQLPNIQRPGTVHCSMLLQYSEILKYYNTGIE